MSDDKDRIAHQFSRMSYADQQETASSLESFTAWLRAIKALADLVPHAIKLFRWIRKKFGF